MALKLLSIGLTIIMAFTYTVLASTQWTPDYIKLDFDTFLATPKVNIPSIGPDGLYAKLEENTCIFTDLGPQSSFAILHPKSYYNFTKQILELDSIQNFDFLRISTKRQVTAFGKRQSDCGEAGALARTRERWANQQGTLTPEEAQLGPNKVLSRRIHNGPIGRRRKGAEKTSVWEVLSAEFSVLQTDTAIPEPLRQVLRVVAQQQDEVLASVCWDPVSSVDLHDGYEVRWGIRPVLDPLMYMTHRCFTKAPRAGRVDVDTCWRYMGQGDFGVANSLFKSLPAFDHQTILLVTSQMKTITKEGINGEFEWPERRGGTTGLWRRRGSFMEGAVAVSVCCCGMAEDDDVRLQFKYNPLERPVTPNLSRRQRLIKKAPATSAANQSYIVLP
ncbi:hypothetical protein S40288_11629 [Stachybotrys chartarum IBT 40288]|nr:hypothetical protein S40288_11629 [Stachybotrys chartarum IBT 40288]